MTTSATNPGVTLTAGDLAAGGYAWNRSAGGGLAPAVLAAAAVVTRPLPPALAVTAAGRVTVTLAGHPLLSGSVVPMAAGVATTGGGQDDPAHGWSTAAAPNWSARTAYALAGVDLNVTTTLVNLLATPQTPFLMGLTLAFPAPWSGTLRGVNGYQIAAEGLGYYYPSVAREQVRCWTAGGGGLFASVYADTEADAPHLYNADPQYEQAGPAVAALHLLTTRTVPGGGALTVRQTIRLTTDGSAAGLLSGFKATLPPRPRSRALTGPAVQFASVDKAYLTPTNPGGFNGDQRRIDTPAGVAAFLAWIAPLAGKVQAVIFWAAYLELLGMWPADPVANWHRLDATRAALIAGLKAMGMEPFCTIRADQVPDDRTLIGWLDQLRAWGFTGCYVDSNATPAGQRVVALIVAYCPDWVVIPEFPGDWLGSAHYFGQLTNAAGGLVNIGPDKVAHLAYLTGMTAAAADETGLIDTPAKYAALGPGYYPLVIQDWQRPAL